MSQILDQNADDHAPAPKDITGLTAAELESQLAAGGRLVFYEFCISFILLTLRRQSAVYLLRAGERGIVRGLPYCLLSLFFGWWGVPWGIIYTPLTLVTNLRGGCDVTAQIRDVLARRAEKIPS
jgi:hypothetical protein